MKPIIFCGFQADNGPFNNTVHRIMPVKHGWYRQCDATNHIVRVWLLAAHPEPMFYCSRCSWELECSECGQ